MKRESGLLLTLIILVAAMSVLSPYFLRTGNLLGLTRHLAEVGIIACAMTCIIATSGIDLSVGSLLGLTSIALGYASLAWDPASGIAIAFATGLLG
ncbi:MAG: ABC transporter permease, partial [Candidatus Latescibacterota bacterium]